MDFGDAVFGGTGEIAGNVAATVCPTRSCRYVKFIAEAANAGNVYIGGAGVTKVAGTTTTTCGLELDAGVSTDWIKCTNLNQFYRICDNAGDDLTYIILV